MTIRQVRRRAAGALAVTVLSLSLLTACGGEGSSTDCDLNSCEITFDRGVEANANVLGVEVALVGVEGEQVTIDIAGQEVTLEAGNSTEVAGFNVSVQEVTEESVVVEVTGGE